MHRRTFLNTAAVAAAVCLPGCLAATPAAASICNAAPFIPTKPDEELLRLCTAFHEYCAQDNILSARYCSMPLGTPEARGLACEIEDRYVGWAALGDAVYDTAPQTPAGAAAFLGVFLARDHDHIEEVLREPLRTLRDALAGMVQS